MVHEKSQFYEMSPDQRTPSVTADRSHVAAGHLWDKTECQG